MSTSRCLVTGATGYVGRHLLRALRESGRPAVVLVRDRAAWLAQPWIAEAGPVDVIEGSPLDTSRYEADPALRGVTTIFHSAAIVKHSRTGTDEMTELNVRGTLSMVQLGKQLGARVVFVSSSGTVGCFRFAGVTADEDAPYAEDLVGRWPYYASKIRAERESRQLADKLGVELTFVRPPVLLGPDDHRLRSTGYVLKAIERKVPAIPNGGMNFTDVRDVASALVRLGEKATVRPIYHLPGHASSLREFFAMVTEISGVRGSKVPLPTFAAFGLARVGRPLPRRPSWFPDPVVLEMGTRHWGLTSLFAHELGYEPRSPRQTLVDTVEWLRSLPAARRRPHGEAQNHPAPPP
jgi:dihydroflavonol-4-reductase